MQIQIQIHANTCRYKYRLYTSVCLLQFFLVLSPDQSVQPVTADSRFCYFTAHPNLHPENHIKNIPNITLTAHSGPHPAKHIEKHSKNSPKHISRNHHHVEAGHVCGIQMYSSITVASLMKLLNAGDLCHCCGIWRESVSSQSSEERSSGSKKAPHGLQRAIEWGRKSPLCW